MMCVCVRVCHRYTYNRACMKIQFFFTHIHIQAHTCEHTAHPEIHHHTLVSHEYIQYAHTHLHTTGVHTYCTEHMQIQVHTHICGQLQQHNRY